MAELGISPQNQCKGTTFGQNYSQYQLNLVLLSGGWRMDGQKVEQIDKIIDDQQTLCRHRQKVHRQKVDRQIFRN